MRAWRSTQLAAHGRDGVRQEVVPRLGVEALRGLGQAQQGDLLEVVEVDAAVAVATCHGAGDAHVGLDEAVDELAGVGRVRLDRAEVGDDVVGATGTFLALDGLGRCEGGQVVLGDDRHVDHGSVPSGG
jgi:hypothetical protein